MKPPFPFRIRPEPIVNGHSQIIAYEIITKLPYPYPNMAKLLSILETHHKNQLIECLNTAIIQNSITLNLNPKYIWYNMPPNCLADTNFLKNFMEIIEFQKKSHQTGIEITENSRKYVDIAKIGKIIELFKDKSLTVIMDDFGTGHNSLHLLTRYPWDIVKIDGKLINNLKKSQNEQTQKRTRTILKKIIEAIREVEIVTLAEWIEEKYQYEILKNYGCHLFQGYLFTKKQRVWREITKQKPGKGA